MLNAAYMVEAIRTAQEIHGVADITPGMMRDGLENLKLIKIVGLKWALKTLPQQSM